MRIKNLRSRLVLAGLTFVVAFVATGQTMAAKRYAVLVGINQYKHPKLKDPPLKYAVNDVTELNQSHRKSLMPRDSKVDAPRPRNLDSPSALTCGAADVFPPS